MENELQRELIPIIYKRLRFLNNVNNNNNNNWIESDVDALVS